MFFKKARRIKDLEQEVRRLRSVPIGPFPVFPQLTDPRTMPNQPRIIVEPIPMSRWRGSVEFDYFDFCGEEELIARFRAQVERMIHDAKVEVRE